MPDPSRLSDSDALLWRIEGDPVLRSPILVVGLLDRPPTPGRVAAALEHAVAAIPRLHQRLDAGSPWARPRWVDDGAFSLDHHVRHVRAAATGGLDTVLALAEPDAASAFDPARPLWQLSVVDGLEDGAAAFVLRFHHTITDGMGGIELARELFDTSRRPTRRSAAAPPSAEPVQRSDHGPSGVDQTAGWASAAARAAVDPVGTSRAGLRMARSVVKMLAPARAPLSPILLGRGLDRHLRVLDVPLRGLQEAARSTGATVNEVFLAAVGGGLRDYHQGSGAPVDALRITMPISLRTEGDAPGGNRFTPARFILPIGDLDPLRRVEVARGIVRAWRAEPAVGMTPLLAAGLALLPAPVVQRAFGGMLRSVDVDAVDVPGLREPAYLAGARVERLWAFAPPTGAALSVTLVSHVERACVAIATDRAAVRDPDELARCVQRGFDEVLAMGTERRGRRVPA
ncbi:MAG TPA: wax ester/triacylglycerol synthase domain-containing protein [Acidimicrobiales bacterium]|nr:wax ester/triacylglycerol synthase domain-containing protein [Acidimicrobiales bacterium]